MIPSSQILLDTCPTSILCNNKETIGNIRYCNSDETLIAYKNGGSKIFTQIVPFKILPMEVHFNPDSMANIIAVNNVASITWVYISMDSKKERVIIVDDQNNMIKFHECCDGLYYYDTANKFISHIKSYYF